METASIFSLPPTKPTAEKATAKPTAERITLHCGTEVSAAFYNRNKQAALAGIRDMRPGRKKTFRKICGEAHWLTMSVGEASLAGLCGVTMATRKELPLILAGKNGKNAELYLLN